jgi:2-succinyl-5-enolpyruvyl-6-hydroxy-3-cyclohexene-1-carboxylate synthase
VHLNFPFREPLLPDGGEAVVPPDVGEARPDGLPYAAAHAPRRLAPQPLVQRLAGELAAAERGLLVCGPQDDPALPGALVGLAGRLGWPLLADGLSGLRSGPHDQELLVDAYDAFLRDESFALEHGPDLVLRFGATPTSKTLTQCLARHPHSRHIVVDEGEGWRDPTLLASDFVHAEPVALCESLTDALPVALSASAPWTDRWLDANRRTRRALGARLSTLEEPFEGRVFAELPALLPEGSTLYVGNSMPVRDLDAFFSATVRSVRVLCNRGANGIDGVVSSALGAGAGSGGPLVLVLGDLSFYHDMNGLLAAKLYGLDATVILLNNDGGGIFSFLPQAATPEHFETLFGTPHGLDLGAASRMYGGRHTLARTWEGFRDAVRAGIGSPGLAVVELRTDRGRNVELHRELWAAVAAALAEPGRPRAVDAVAIGAE